MDSMATEGLQATGYSICYELGMFKQKFENGRQTEVADNWRTAAESWLIPRHEDEVEVRFGGQISPSWDSLGHYHAEHTGYTPSSLCRAICSSPATARRRSIPCVSGTL